MNISTIIKKNIGIITALFFALIVFSSTSWFSNKEYNIYGSSDYLLNVFSAEQLAYKHTLSYGKTLNDQYKDKIFAPIGTVITKDGNVLPATFPGMFFLNAIALIFSKKALPFVIPLMAVLLLFFFFKLCNLFYCYKTSLFCTLLFVFSAPFIITAVSLLSNIPCLTFYFASLYYLFLGINKNKFSCFVLSGIFASIAFWIRYDIAIAFLPLIIFIFYKDHRLCLTKNCLAIIPFILSIGLLLLFVSSVYGGPLNNIGSFNESQLVKNPTDRYKQEVRAVSWFIPFSSLEGFLANSTKYTLLINPLLFIAFILGIYYYKKEYGKSINPKNNAFFVFFLLSFLLIILYYAGGIFSGYETLAVGGSYPRYLLIAYAAMSVFAGFFINNNVAKNTIWLIIIVIYIPLNLYGAYFGNLGIKAAMISQKEAIGLIKNLHDKELIHKNSIVFYRYNDLFFFPYYNVANYEMLPIEGREEKLLTMVKDFLEKGYFVYFVQDDYYRVGLPEKYIKYFETKGLSRSPVNGYTWEIKIYDN